MPLDPIRLADTHAWLTKAQRDIRDAEIDLAARRPTGPTASGSGGCVQVHKLLCAGTVEEKVDEMLDEAEGKEGRPAAAPPSRGRPCRVRRGGDASRWAR